MRIYELKGFRLRTGLFLLLWPVFAISNAAAESKREDEVTLETVVAHALAASPLVKEIDAKISERLAEAVALRILPNPELSVGVQYPSFSTNAKNQYGASLTQPFRISHLGLRDTVSSLIEQAASTDQRFAVIELTQNVRLAYVRLWALQQQRSYFTSAKESARKIGRFISDGGSKGLFSKGEEKIFTAELERASADLIGLESEIKKAEAELLRLSIFSVKDRTLNRPTVISDSELDALSSDTDGSTLPIQGRYLLLEKVSKERFNLSRRDAFPALAPQLTYSRNEDGFNFVGVGITVELPLFNRNQPEQLQRSAELQAAIAQKDYFQGSTFKSQIDLLVESLRGSVTQAKAYEERVIPALESAVTTHEKQLRAGQGTVLLVWQTQRELLELQGRLLEIWIRAFSNQSELVILTGKEF